MFDGQKASRSPVRFLAPPVLVIGEKGGFGQYDTQASFCPRMWVCIGEDTPVGSSLALGFVCVLQHVFIEP